MIVPWGHRNKDKDLLRVDALSVSLDVLHLVWSIAAYSKRLIGQMGIEIAFLQGHGSTRRVYVRSPRKANTPNVMCRLELPAYVLTDLVRLWYSTSDK